MKSERPFHSVILQQWLTPGHFLQNLSGDILAVQQQTKLRFVEHRIVQQRQKYIGRWMMQQRGQLLRRGDTGALPIWIVSWHPIPSRPEPRPPRAKPEVFRLARAA